MENPFEIINERLERIENLLENIYSILEEKKLILLLLKLWILNNSQII